MEKVTNCPEMMDTIQHMGFLPLFDCGISGFSGDELVDPSCRYHLLPDGGWEWALWKWKGTIVTEGNCVYGKFFAGKAGFITLDWWTDFCNYRRSRHPKPEEGTIEDTILLILRTNRSMITRELRAACGFTGPKMRSRFDAYVSRLQAACWVVTEDFVYPHDKHGHPYGWGWSLLTTPEQLYGREACHCPRTPEESFQRIMEHLSHLLPQATRKQLEKIIG